MATYSTVPPSTRTQCVAPLGAGGSLGPNASYIGTVEAHTDTPWNPATSNSFGPGVGRWDGAKFYEDWNANTTIGNASADTTVMHKAGHLLMIALSPKIAATRANTYASYLPPGAFSTSIDTIGPYDSDLTALYARIHALPWGQSVSPTLTIPGTSVLAPGVGWGGLMPEDLRLIGRQEPNNDANQPGGPLGTPDEYCQFTIQIVKVYKRYLRDHPNEKQRIYFCTGMAATGSANLSSYLPWHGFNSDGTKKAWCLAGWVIPGADIYFYYAAPNTDPSVDHGGHGTGLVMNPGTISKEQSIPDEPSKFKPYEQWVEQHFGFDQPFVWPEFGFRYIQETLSTNDFRDGWAAKDSPLDISTATGDPTWREVQLMGGTSKRADIPGGQPVRGLIDWVNSARNRRSDGGPRLDVIGFWHGDWRRTGGTNNSVSTLTFDPLAKRDDGTGSKNGEFRDGHKAIRRFLAALKVPGTLVGLSLTISASTDRVTAAAHGLADGDHLVLRNNTAGGLTNADYYVAAATTNDFQLAATVGGARVDVTSNGIADVYKVVSAAVLGPPTGLTATTPTADAETVTLSWSNDVNAVDVYRETFAGPDTTGTPVVTGNLPRNADGTPPMTWQPAPHPGSTYTYRLQSVDKAGKKDSTGATTTVVYPPATDTTAPTVPANLQLPVGGVASWDPSTDPESDVAGYDLAIDGNTAAPVNGDTLITATTYQLPATLTPGAHSYQARAVNKVGLASAWSAVRSFTVAAPVVDTTPPTVPVPHLPIPTADGAIVSCDPSVDPESGVAGYRWAIDGDTANPVSGVAPVPGTSYQYDGLAPNSEHTWQAQAVNGQGLVSAWTQPGTFLTLPVRVGGDLTTITLRGSYRRGNGDPSTGQVTVTPREWRQVPDLDVILPVRGETYELDGHGDFEAPVHASDDPRIVPPGVGYDITEQVDGDVHKRTVYPQLAVPVLNLADVLDDGSVVTPAVTPPGAPTAVTGQSLNSGELTVFWSPPPSPAAAPLDDVQVQLDDGSTYQAGRGDITSMTISGLTPGDVHTATVAVHNSAGWSPASADTAPVTIAGSAAVASGYPATYASTY